MFQKCVLIEEIGAGRYRFILNLVPPVRGHFHFRHVEILAESGELFAILFIGHVRRRLDQVPPAFAVRIVRGRARQPLREKRHGFVHTHRARISMKLLENVADGFILYGRDVQKRKQVVPSSIFCH